MASGFMLAAPKNQRFRIKSRYVINQGVARYSSALRQDAILRSVLSLDLKTGLLDTLTWCAHLNTAMTL